MSKNDSLYLLLGPEEGEKDAFVERLIVRISKAIGQAPEIHRFYSFDSEIPEVLAVLRNGSLFSPYRVVLLRNAELLTRNSDLDQLSAYAAHPAEQSSLVMFSEEIGRIGKRLEKLVPKENKVIFWELFENQKTDWIINFFKKRKIHIDSKTVTLLLEMVENNTKELKEVCEKLSIFFGKGSEIGYADVEKILYHSKDENVFTLFDRIAARDLDASLEVLTKLLLSRETDAVSLLAGVLFQVRRLKSLKLLIERRYSYQEAFAQIGIPGKRLQKTYSAALQRYTLGELQAIIQLIARFDYRVRSLGAVLHPNLLQLFLYYLIVKGGSGAFRF